MYLSMFLKSCGLHILKKTTTMQKHKKGTNVDIAYSTLAMRAFLVDAGARVFFC